MEVRHLSLFYLTNVNCALANRRSVLILGSLLWESFDARYKGLLDTLESCNIFLRDEIVLSVFEITDHKKRVIDTEAQKAAEQRILIEKDQIDLGFAKKGLDQTTGHDTNACISMNTLSALASLIAISCLLAQNLSKIQDWLQNPVFVDEYDRAIELREEGTCLWAIEGPMFSQWLDATTNADNSHERSFGKETLWIHGEDLPYL